jgi:hypothetical protein
MKGRMSVIAVGAAVILGTTGALVVPAVASAHSTTHTLKFTSVEKKSIEFTKASGGQQDTDVNSKGKTVGFDMLYFTQASATSASVNITVNTKGGFLYCTGTISFKTGKASGKVTGGTGAFKGATGTIKGTATSPVKEAVTITYRT